ncbi:MULTISPECIES: rhodanese-like domain-containing protein [unclassified Moraxella]|uniref:rhodanese-like domain-containing protein n=1 Tax=unclassified Moraxella TaxID=2685852 RepID=UPI003AF5AE95
MSLPQVKTILKQFRPSKKHLLTLAGAVVVGMLLMPTANANTVVIDVRTPQEYQVDHPNGAINIPHSEIVAKIASQGVSKSDTIKLYSRGGGRAEQAKNALQSAGYTNVEIQK